MKSKEFLTEAGKSIQWKRSYFKINYTKKIGQRLYRSKLGGPYVSVGIIYKVRNIDIFIICYTRVSGRRLEGMYPT